MNRSTISLGHILGIPIGLDYSWFLIFALLTWSLATSYFPSEFKNWPVTQYWIVGAVTVLLMFGSVLLHELGHWVQPPLKPSRLEYITLTWRPHDDNQR